ncbi:MAG: exodeoxyribonuclease VII small subunit [Pirellulaceae bacterium]|nr:exodeoxyribonuclease VII small subunit [Pirellulaceae bacterium]
MTKKNEKPRIDSGLSFEEALGELETMVAQLEHEGLSLDDSLSNYEKGVAYLNFCHQKLQAAEQKVEVLKGIDENGDEIVLPFEGAKTTDLSGGTVKLGESEGDSDQNDGEKANIRKKKTRRITKKAKKTDIDENDSLF